MAPNAITAWFVNTAPGNDGSGQVILQVPDEPGRAGVEVRSFDQAARVPLPRAKHVHIHLPAYRGKRIVPLLAWLAVERLGLPGATVTWALTKNQGPGSVRRMLEDHGWELTRRKLNGMIELSGIAPAAAARPDPLTCTVELGPAGDVELAADYGVFSPNRLDDGTRLLLDVALEHPPVETVADIGIGYGALAVGLVMNARAQAAVATDVDAIALWLAGRNAHDHDVDLTTVLSADPLAVPHTPLTGCNIPTHISASATAAFMAALAERARHGSLLVVVHAALEARYAQHLAALPGQFRRAGARHVVRGAVRPG